MRAEAELGGHRRPEEAEQAEQSNGVCGSRDHAAIATGTPSAEPGAERCPPALERGTDDRDLLRRGPPRMRVKAFRPMSPSAGACPKKRAPPHRRRLADLVDEQRALG
jgi:hypothetical protein